MPFDARDPFPETASLLDQVLQAVIDAPEAYPQAPHVLDTLSLDLPVELSVELRTDTRQRIDMSTPTQTVETSVMPVWHQLRVTLALEVDTDTVRNTADDTAVAAVGEETNAVEAVVGSTSE